MPQCGVCEWLQDYDNLEKCPNCSEMVCLSCLYNKLRMAIPDEEFRGEHIINWDLCPLCPNCGAKDSQDTNSSRDAGTGML